jgi:predicted SprT family Zn-dependent metalloprotease
MPIRVLGSVTERDPRLLVCRRPLDKRHGGLWEFPGGEVRIRLAAHLANGRRDLLEEVLCHELAHVAVHRLHGPKARPHGREWKGLVAAAGFEPRVRFPLEEGGFPPRPPRRRARYEHRCPVCQAMRMAGRPVRNWRCVECLRAGLSGKLVITRIPLGVGEAARTTRQPPSNAPVMAGKKVGLPNRCERGLMVRIRG